MKLFQYQNYVSNNFVIYHKIRFLDLKYKIINVFIFNYNIEVLLSDLNLTRLSSDPIHLFKDSTSSSAFILILSPLIANLCIYFVLIND